MKTGNTFMALHASDMVNKPQWSPVMKTGNTGRGHAPPDPEGRASMEPGHEDREYLI